MLLVDDLAAGGTKNLRHTPRGLVTLVNLDPIVLLMCLHCDIQGIIFAIVLILIQLSYQPVSIFDIFLKSFLP